MEIKRKIGEHKSFKGPADPRGILVSVVGTKAGTKFSRTLNLQPSTGIASGVTIRPETMEQIVAWAKGEDV
jgi:hypothetical protein